MPADIINECTITAYLMNLEGDVPTIDLSNPPKLLISNDRSFQHGNNVIAPFTKEAAFNASGVATISIIETETVGEELEFVITIPVGKGSRSIFFETAIVPDEAARDLDQITVVRQSDFG